MVTTEPDLKNSLKEMRENQHLFITLTSQKSEKHAWDTRGYSFKHALI